jgi:uncharacterized protein YdiU (UPF0061 family)
VARLAAALTPLFDGTEALEDGLSRNADAYVAADRRIIAAKLGLASCGDDDVGRMRSLQALMQRSEADMTLLFRALADVDPAAPGLAPLAHAFYDPARRDAEAAAWQAWLDDYGARIRRDARPAGERRAALDAVNPRYVLRNYLAQQAIDRAEEGDESLIGELLDLIGHPYDDQPGREAYAALRPDWARARPGCSMLSCSS